MRIEVIVSNIGTVYSGNSLKQAKFHFNEYVEQSKTHYGRASMESVWLMKQDEIVQEHVGELYQNEGDL